MGERDEAAAPVKTLASGGTRVSDEERRRRDRDRDRDEATEACDVATRAP